MPLELDTRQRAMLREMGVHVWLPESTPAVDFQPEVQVAKPSPMVRTATPPPPVASLRTLTPAAAPLSVPPTQPGEALTLDAMDWQMSRTGRGNFKNLFGCLKYFIDLTT